MAQVLLARALVGPHAGELVAIKRLHPDLSGDLEFVEMLEREAAVSLQLRHPNIVATFEQGAVGDQLYLAQEYVPGTDLFRLLQRLERRQLPVPHQVTAYLGLEACRGLQHAHSLQDHEGRPLGLVHRDISPMNLLLSRRGEVKICDFGIARATARASRTSTGVLKGKFHYLSPEYACGEPFDQRSDLFSLGICLWEAIAGRMLYERPTDRSLIDVVRAAEVPAPSRFRADLPPRLEQIVLRVLQRNPARRHPSAAELGRELGEWLGRDQEQFARDRLTDLLHNAETEDVAVPGGASLSQPGGRVGELGCSRASYQRQADQDTARIILRESSIGTSGEVWGVTDPPAEQQTKVPHRGPLQTDEQGAGDD